MIRGVILAAVILAAVEYGCTMATAAVFLQGHRVTVHQIGAIDASPCTNPHGCAKAVISLRWNHRANDHLVRCPTPKRLHVTGITQTRKGKRVSVYACGRTYLWRLPR